MDKKPEKLVPEVRFKGFTDDWEQHKPKDYLRESRILGHSGRNSLKLTVKLWGKGIVAKKTIGNGSQNTKYYKRMPGQLMYGKLDFLHAAFGIVPSYLRGFESTTDSPAFDIVSGDPSFLLNEFLRKRFYERYGLMANGSRKAKRVHEKDFLNMAFYSGSDEEQYKIGAIIETINSLITLQQRKLEQLKLLEKALQQKLFPNSFQEKPLLRILHGDNSWWNSYIGEVFTERVDKGSSEKLLSVSITDGVYPFDESKRKNNSSDDKHNYKKVFQNDIAYNSMRLWQGALGVSKYEGIVSPAYTVLKPLPNQNSIFYEFMFKNIDMLHIFQRNSQGLTSDTWNLKFNQLQHIKIKTTNLNSQNKIAKLLIKIEELKNNESNYYHNLMTLKKYLLQKLFI